VTGVLDTALRRYASRKQLFVAWAVIGGAVVAGLAIWGPDFYYLRGIAPWPRLWIILFFLSLWCWAGLRFIARWIWAWVVMALAPLCLFIPLRYNLDAWWLMPLLIAVIAASGLTVVVVVWWELRRRRGVRHGARATATR